MSLAVYSGVPAGLPGKTSGTLHVTALIVTYNKTDQICSSPLQGHAIAGDAGQPVGALESRILPPEGTCHASDSE